MELAKQKGFISETDIKNIKSVIEEKLNWQRDNLKKIENDFFTGKCGSGGTGGADTLIALPAAIFSILFSLLRWYLV